MTNVTDHKLRRLFDKSPTKRYRKGELLIRAGDIPPGVFYIVEGHVKAYALTRHGQEKLHLVYKANEILPLMWLLKGEVRNEYFEALDEVHVKSLSRDRIIDDLQNDHTLLTAILSKAADQVAILINRLENLSYQSAYERVVYRMLFLAARFGQKHSYGIVVPLSFTHQSIANSINLARETTSRCIERLERNNLVRYESHRIIIPNIEKLKNEIDEPVNPSLWNSGHMSSRSLYPSSRYK